jgi:hypothetical protein
MLVLSTSRLILLPVAAAAGGRYAAGIKYRKREYQIYAYHQ